METSELVSVLYTLEQWQFLRMNKREIGRWCLLCFVASETLTYGDSFFLLINGDSIWYPSSKNWYPSFTKDVTLSYSAWHLITWYDRGIITSTPIEKKWLLVRPIVITDPVYCYIPINNKYSSKLSQKSINHNKLKKKKIIRQGYWF